jgi:glutamine synthetase
LIEKIEKIIQEKSIHTIEVIHTDTLGMLGAKMIPAKSFLKNYQLMNLGVMTIEQLLLDYPA